MSVWKNQPDGKTVQQAKLTGQWSARPIELMESHAYRVLSRAAHLVMSRIEIELRRHGGRDNGRLPVTFDDFVLYGLHRHAIAPAIRELEAVGIIRVTERGRAGNAEFRSPNLQVGCVRVSARWSPVLPLTRRKLRWSPTTRRLSSRRYRAWRLWLSARQPTG
jgi:hypothetical protein